MDVICVIHGISTENVLDLEMGYLALTNQETGVANHSRDGD